MIPNIEIRKEIEIFNQENPWAFEFDPRQNYKDIEIGSIDISANWRWQEPDTTYAY